jgi:dipeptidyl aminopeptidase/acylaminoacyl peptidase
MLKVGGQPTISMRATLVSISALCVAVAAMASADEPDVSAANALAAAFGATPVRSVRLSPDGLQLSLITMHPSGVALARVVDLTTGTANQLVAGNRDSRAPRDVAWCGWANDARLICSVRTLYGSARYSAGLVGVDSDGANFKELTGQQLGSVWARRPYRVINWLPDDPDHVLGLVTNLNVGTTLARFNIHDGSASVEVAPPTQVYDWITDARGNPRVYRRVLGDARWFVRETSNSTWTLLHQYALIDTEDAFEPVGFNDEGNELLFLDDHEGRRALFALDLANNRSRRLIYAHESLDVADVQTLGKYQRPVAATYIDDRMRFEFFDERVEKIHSALQERFAGKNVSLIDEDWNGRYYLVLVDAADDPGSYYRFDTERDVLLELFPAYPQLAGRAFAPVREIAYPADDGARVPAYLTLPRSAGTELPPAVVLLHDGPASRDHLRFDFLVQYLAANGYAVLQSNYRGSSGYGRAWAGQGGYRDWRRAIGDIADATEFLAREGIADPKRICAVGRGYGGYAALMSAIENSGHYHCVVSMAGISDLRTYSAMMRGYIGGVAHSAFVGTDEAVLDAGSPLRRVDEIDVPVLLFHGARDGEVFVQQSADLARSLRRAGKDSELVEYEDAEHDFWADRVDLLTRLSAFLGEHLAK